jgi:hypothetical protein
MITESTLTRLGFTKQNDWTLDVEPNDGWPTRLTVLGCKTPSQVFIEQPEFTDGETWDWEIGNCVSVVCDDERLVLLVAVLTQKYEAENPSQVSIWSRMKRAFLGGTRVG